MEQTPLGSIIACNSQVLNTNALIMISVEDVEKKYKSLLTHLISLKDVSPVFFDKAMNQLTDYIRKSRVHQDIFLEFNQEKDSLDNFYFKKCNLNKYNKLASTVKIFLTMSHGQDSVERGFNINGRVLEKNLNEKSITGRHLVKDHMMANNLQPQKIEISNKMITNVKSAHLRTHLRSIT